MTEADVSRVTTGGAGGPAALLVEGLRAGDEEAYGRLYDDFGEPVHRYVARLLGVGDELAEDVMVQTLAEAVRNIVRFDPRRSSFPAWLYGIARQRAREELRRLARRKAVPAGAQVSLDALPEQAGAEDLAAELAARLDARRRVGEIRACLSGVEMEVLVLRCVHGYSLREIGHIIDRSERAAESLLRRAKRKARERLDRHDG
jgi:RNA polymerase sigma-70 factor (ECF subfamily)